MRLRTPEALLALRIGWLQPEGQPPRPELHELARTTTRSLDHLARRGRGAAPAHGRGRRAAGGPGHAPADGAGRAREVLELHRAAGRERARARRQPGGADRRRDRPLRGDRAAAVGDRLVGRTRRPRDQARRSSARRAARPTGASRASTSTSRIEGAGRAIGTLDLLLRPLRGRDGQVAFIVAEGRADHRPQARRAAPRAPERGAVGADAAARARARLPRAAARRALARPARAAAGRDHALRAGAARRARTRRCARSWSTSGWPR